MANRLIPRSDEDFHQMSKHFVSQIAADPARYGIDQDTADAMVAAQKLFAERYQVIINPVNRSDVAIKEKNHARENLKRLITRAAQLMRMNEDVDQMSMELLNIPMRPTRIKRKSCPMEPPRLRFVRALHEGSGGNVQHELSFGSNSAGHRAKPEGAVRLELFVDLIPPDSAIPDRPGANYAGRPWYMRSFTRSPIMLVPPMAKVQMRVVYWARWADSAGNVGPFSATAVGWIEGGNISAPGCITGGSKLISREFEKMDSSTTPAMDTKYSVAVIEAHYLSFEHRNLVNKNVTIHTNALPDQTNNQAKNLEGPVETNAA